MELFSEYFKKEHGLSRIDARVKIGVALAVLIMVLSCKGLFFPSLVTSLCLLLCFAMRIPFKVFALRFSEPLFLASVVFLLKLFFSGETALFSVSLPGLTLTAHKEGLMEGIAIGSRIVAAVSIVAVTGFSTPFTEFMAGISWFGVPKGLVEIAMFAYRYIFLLLDEAMVIYNAQKNRLGYSSVKRGLSSFGILTGSLTLKAFEHSQNTTVAMVQRGYDGTIPLLKHKPFRPKEVLLSVLFLATMGALWRL